MNKSEIIIRDLGEGWESEGHDFSAKNEARGIRVQFQMHDGRYKCRGILPDSQGIEAYGATPSEAVDNWRAFLSAEFRTAFDSLRYATERYAYLARVHERFNAGVEQ